MLLAAGIDPMTGEFLPEDSVVKRPEVVEALRDGVEALRRMQAMPDEGRRKPRQPREERPWTGDELRLLKQMYIAGASLRMMRKTLGRNTRELEKQLRVYVGSFPQCFLCYGYPIHEPCFRLPCGHFPLYAPDL